MRRQSLLWMWLWCGFFSLAGITVAAAADISLKKIERISSDSTRVVPLKTDSTKAKVNLPPKVKTRKNSTLIPIDSSNIIPKTYQFSINDTTRRYPLVHRDELEATNESANRDWWEHLPGIYPLGFGFFGQQSYMMVPYDPAGMHTEILGRDNGDPIRGITPSDLIPTRGIVQVSGGPLGFGGNTIRLEPTFIHPRRPYMSIDYRDGFYSLGRVDWRFFNPLNKTDFWGIGVAVSQAEGRFVGTGLNSMSLLAHYQRAPVNQPAMTITARQYVDSNGIGNTQLYRQTNRYDIDWIVKQGVWEPDSLKDSTGKLIRVDSIGYPKFASWRWQSYYTSNQSRIRPAPGELGRKIGTIGQIRFPSRFGILGSKLRVDEVRGLLADRGQIVQPQSELGVSWEHATKIVSKVEISNVVTRGFAPQWQGVGAFTYSTDTNSFTTLWGSRTVRFPTLQELAGYQPNPIVEFPYQSPFYATDYTVPFAGDFGLEPVQQWRIGLQYKRTILKQVTLELYGSFIREANPIKLVDTRDVSVIGNIREIRPINWSARSYRLGTVKIRSNPFGWGIANLDLSSAGYESVKPTFVPQTWGFMDIGTRGHWGREKLSWSGIGRIHYIGKRPWMTSFGSSTMPAVAPVDILLSVKIYSMRIQWGVANFFQSPYEAMPGYPAMHREEVWGVQWNIWD